MRRSVCQRHRWQAPRRPLYRELFGRSAETRWLFQSPGGRYGWGNTSVGCRFNAVADVCSDFQLRQ